MLLSVLSAVNVPRDAERTATNGARRYDAKDMRRLASNRVAVAAALAVGFVLRALFVWRHPLFTGDALVYGELAHHMLKEHVYGLMDAGVLKPTLIRLPGYPLFLAACFKVFGDANYLAVLWAQVVVDLATCLLLAATAARIAGRRAGMWALWLAVLCPFTANYAAVVVAECLSMFCVALAFYALERWVTAWREDCRLGVVGAPGRVRTDGAVLLRPDQGLLAAAVVPAMLWVGWRAGTHISAQTARAKMRHPDALQRVAPAVLASLVVVLPLGFWAVRNWRVFHVVQPISPKYANDPGEEVPYGFMRWYRTWAVGFPATVKVYWQYDGDVISINDLPARAFDSPEQRAETAEIFARYNQEQASTAGGGCGVCAAGGGAGAGESAAVLRGAAGGAGAGYVVPAADRVHEDSAGLVEVWRASVEFAASVCDGRAECGVSGAGMRGAVAVAARGSCGLVDGGVCGAAVRAVANDRQFRAPVHDGVLSGGDSAGRASLGQG